MSKTLLKVFTVRLRGEQWIKFKTLIARKFGNNVASKLTDCNLVSLAIDEWINRNTP
jgi:hypothetical protein